jgi:hypothetical protein
MKSRAISCIIMDLQSTVPDCSEKISLNSVTVWALLLFSISNSTCRSKHVVVMSYHLQLWTRYRLIILMLMLWSHDAGRLFAFIKLTRIIIWKHQTGLKTRQSSSQQMYMYVAIRGPVHDWNLIQTCSSFRKQYYLVQIKDFLVATRVEARRF